MSVYIKGMDMPKEDEISKCFLIRHDGEVWVVEFDNLISDLGYVACYPTNPAKAIHVPDHGKLIDVDAVTLDGGPYEYDEWCKWALEQYLNAPTIIPADKEEEE